MSTKSSVTTSMVITFGLTMLLTSGSGAFAALSYSLLTSGLVGAFVLAVKESSHAWYSWPRRSFWSYSDSYYSRSRPIVLDSPAPAPVVVVNSPAPVVPHVVAVSSRPIVPAGPIVVAGGPPAPMPLAAPAPKPYLPSQAHVPASAGYSGSSFHPAPGRTPHPPASAGSSVRHESSRFVPGGVAHASTSASVAHPSPSSHSGPAGSALVSSSFRPANVPPAHPPSSSAMHVSRAFRPAKK